MKGPIRTILLAGFMVASMTTAFAQAPFCGALTSGTTIPCKTAVCNSSVTIYGATNVTGGGWGNYLTVGYTTCCGITYGTMLKGGMCVPYALRENRQQIQEFAQTHTVWVADCSGHFGPLPLSWTSPSKPIDLKPKPLLN